MPLNCPKHPEMEMEKNNLDSYYCPTCDNDWFIHAHKNRKRGIKSDAP